LLVGGRQAAVITCRSRHRMLKHGDKAPDFTLLDQNGEPFTLSESLKRKVWHLIYFYP